MPRGRVRIQYIENSSKRRTTLKRRLKSLIKKVNELTILCHVVALLVVYRDPDVEQPEVVWPSVTEAIAVAGQYMSLNSEKLKKALDGEGFVQELVDKERAKLQNLQRTHETKRCIHDLFLRRQSLNLQGLTLTPQVVRELRNLNLQAITNVQCKLQSTLRAVSDRLKEKRSGSTSASPQQQGMLPPAELEAPVAPPQPQEVEMFDDFFVAPPAGPDAAPVVPLPPPPPMAPMEMDPPHVADAPMTGLGGFIFDVLNDDYDVAGDGSDLLTPEELRDILVRAGILAPPPPNDD